METFAIFRGTKIRHAVDLILKIERQPNIGIFIEEIAFCHA